MKMFPKVLWMRFGLKKENGDMMFLPPAVYNNKRRIIFLNAHKLVSPKGLFLASCLFHEFTHHLVNVFDLSDKINKLVDAIDDAKCNDVKRWIESGGVKVVFLDRKT